MTRLRDLKDIENIIK